MKKYEEKEHIMAIVDRDILGNVLEEEKLLNRAELIKLKIAEANSTKSEEKIMEVFIHVLDLIESEFTVKGKTTVMLFHTHPVFTELFDLGTNELRDIYIKKIVHLLQREGFLVNTVTRTKCIKIFLP
jgi:hypothetical protein